MKLQTLGTGSILTSALSACSIVDDRILIDVPNGAMKAARRAKLTPSELDACLITHFHADHYFDVVFLLLEQGLRNVRSSEFLLAGPPELEQRVESLFSLAYPESWAKVKENSRVRFYELPPEGGQFTVPGYKITAVPVKHRTPVAFGYIVSDSDAAVGFSGDTEVCDGLSDILRNVSTAVVDASFLTGRSGHMGVDEVLALKEKFPSVNLITTHMTDDVRDKQWPGLTVPSDGSCFKVSGHELTAWSN
ncbi:ribonuclease Z [Streptomyces sp. NPDC051642]|uniref:MBL fold metallo-hydrolase n=1 Tax=Streptomyces sp. NPDC051642 TaxID=3154646 RepID=UPI0034455D01